ncbi:MAG: DUF1223 domain-containing protein [Minwuia sp.]|uniref:DUF1223 domain-containing protein n=1 Tax=Minwuia sp. TaxID=2493630 RepID=UPI003A840B67
MSASAGGRYAYTPQIVVGGQDQVVGSRKAAVEHAISARQTDPMVEIELKPMGKGHFHVVLAPRKLKETAWVWVVMFDNRHDVDIKRGENSGKTLSYFNVVRHIERIAVWDGEAPLTVPVDVNNAWDNGRDGCAVIVQAGGYGPILGAARLVRSGS